MRIINTIAHTQIEFKLSSHTAHTHISWQRKCNEKGKNLKKQKKKYIHIKKDGWQDGSILNKI